MVYPSRSGLFQSKESHFDYDRLSFSDAQGLIDERENELILEFHKNGVSLALIAKSVGKTEEEVEAIIRSLG